jgi:hypothetical protein
MMVVTMPLTKRNAQRGEQPSGYESANNADDDAADKPKLLTRRPASQPAIAPTIYKKASSRCP